MKPSEIYIQAAKDIANHKHRFTCRAIIDINGEDWNCYHLRKYKSFLGKYDNLCVSDFEENNTNVNETVQLHRSIALLFMAEYAKEEMD